VARSSSAASSGNRPEVHLAPLAPPHDEADDAPEQEERPEERRGGAEARGADQREGEALAEGVVVDEVRPGRGRAAEARIGEVHRPGLRRDRLRVQGGAPPHRRQEVREGGPEAPVVLDERLLAGEPLEDDGLAERERERHVLAPLPVDGQKYEPIEHGRFERAARARRRFHPDLGGQRGAARHHLVTKRLHQPSLVGEQLAVRGDAPPHGGALPVHDALQVIEPAPEDGIVDPTLRIGRARGGGERLAGADPRDELVLEAHEELARPRVALTPGAAAELVVDPAAVVAVRADDVQAPERGHAVALPRVRAPEDDVGPAARHVGRDGHGTEAPRVGDDLGFARIVPGVQDLHGEAALGEPRGERLGLLDRSRAHEDRPAALVRAPDLRHDRRELVGAGREDPVGRIVADAGDVGRDHDGLEPVGLVQLLRRGARRGGHARDAAVRPEELAHGRAREHRTGRADGHALLGLEGHVQALGPLPVPHHAPRVLVDDLDPIVADDVVAVPLEQRAGVKRAVQRREQLLAPRRVQIRDAQPIFAPREPLVGQGHGASERVHVVVRAGREPRHELRQRAHVGRTALEDTREHEGDACLVDEERIGLVHDRPVERPEHPIAGREDGAIPEPIEADLLGGRVGDVGGVRASPLGRARGVLDGPHAEAQEAVDRPHPRGVPARQVVVEREDVRPSPRERADDRREHRDERLAFARLHLDERAVAQGQAREELHVVRGEPHGPARHLGHDREGVRPLGAGEIRPAPQPRGPRAEGLVVRRLEGAPVLPDRPDPPRPAPQIGVHRDAPDPIEEPGPAGGGVGHGRAGPPQQ